MGLGEYNGQVFPKEGSEPKKTGGLTNKIKSSLHNNRKLWKKVGFFSRIGFIGSLLAMVIFQTFFPIFMFVFFAIGCVLGLMFS